MDSTKCPPLDESKDDGMTEEFNFPFRPYDIQVQLMKTAYSTFKESKFALLESPTGTGKSLSLICSSLTWLTDHRAKHKQELEARKNDLSEQIAQLRVEEEISGDWLKSQTKIQDLNKKFAEVDQELSRLVRFEQRNEARRHAKLHNVPLEEYEVIRSAKSSASEIQPRRTSTEDSVMIEEDDEDIEKKIKEESEEEHVRPKIYYASRTHTQLSQFINEIKRTRFGDINVSPTIKLTPLASRANLCVNPEVTKLKDPSAINERCVELQRETKKENRCPFLKAKQVHLLKEKILSSVQDIEDIVSQGRVMGSCPYYATRMSVPEADVVVLPYNNLLHHETRKASSLDLKESIVIVDEAHNILETICSIHSASITGQQLIGSHTILSRYYKKFHNRMSPRNADTIRSIVQCLTAIIKYLNSPARHLADYECPRSVKLDESISESPCDKNANNAKRVSLSETSPSGKYEELMIDVMKFIGAANIERFNVFKIIDYFNRSQLARKLLGFHRQDNTIDLSLELNGLSTNDAMKTSTPQENAKKKRKLGDKMKPITINDHNKQINDENTHAETNLEFLRALNSGIAKKDSGVMTTYPVYTLVEFLRSLTNLFHDGKILTNHLVGDIQRSLLKFILLNPASQFKQMAEEARSIVLAGGTMQPFSEFIDLLFGPLGINRDRVTLFSCGHVINPDQLFVATLGHGLRGQLLELSYKTKSSFAIIDEIGRSVQTIASTVPAGMVCFFPSYDYEQICFSRWTQQGFIRSIETKCKQVFREPRQSNHSKPILDEYTRVVEKGLTTGRGAMLMCVVGGKMSEGINFNDHLGRCVVMIGLPYANIKSGELRQKMNYYDKTCAPMAGQHYYENLCIKGINQSIGRAIRHRNDYAAIILLDHRFANKASIKNSLPEWMRKSLKEYGQDNQKWCIGLKSFFAKKETLN